MPRLLGSTPENAFKQKNLLLSQFYVYPYLVMFLFTFNSEARSHTNLLLISSIPNMDSICQTVVCIYLPWSPMITLPEHMRSPPVFSGVRVIRSLRLYVCFVDRCLSFYTFSLDHCVVCLSSIYAF